MNFFRWKVVMFLMVLGIFVFFIGMKMVSFYYYSFIIGCVVGCLCCVFVFIIVMKRFDKDNKEGKVWYIKN